MTPLGDRLAARIAQTGPMTVAEYMQACLTDPEHGYYVTRDPLGVAGDFTTAPEISQMFGEMLGLWLAQVWMDQGAPTPFTLAEPGPGRGTLMADILRATARVPGFHAGMRLWLVEQSPVLRARQQTALVGAAPNWADTVDGLPDDAPLFLVANEFFDALPIRQFVASAGGWRERMVGLSGGALSFGLSPEVRLPVLDGRFADVAKGTLVELALPSEAAATAIGARIAAHGGAALVVDYGDWDGTGDTLQAVRAHGFADPLADPGSADLTAHVAFRWLAEAAAPLHPRLATQGQFLTALGIVARAERLAAAQPDAAGQIKDALRRLTHDAEMGRVFKTLALTPQGATPPPGFAP